MKTAVIAFTGAGMLLAEKIGSVLEHEGCETELYLKSRYAAPAKDSRIRPVSEKLASWAARVIPRMDAVVFVGASGIAVRTMAPFVKSKKTDPAVLVLDEAGNFCISLLSGHLGGANELCRLLAGALDACPVITTATDVNRRFAVDVFAKKNGMEISDMQLAKEVSARLLAGEEILVEAGVGFAGDLETPLPRGLIWKKSGKPAREKDPAKEPEKAEEEGAEQPGKNPPFYDLRFLLPGSGVLRLTPKNMVLGIGCRKGTDCAAIETAVRRVLKENDIPPYAAAMAASIDLKKDEPGLLTFCRNQNLPFVTYPAGELAGVPGQFTASSFVGSVTGVDNVCERSAVLASGGGRLAVKKYASDGVTVACAVKDWSVDFA